MTKFADKVKERLANYKQKYFPLLKDGEYNYKGRIVTHPHILPKEHREWNILRSIRKSFWTYTDEQKKRNKKISFHKDFKHLNSSQAMCINFFYPLMEKKKLEIITDYLGFSDEVVKCSEFEKESDIDNNGNGKPTNFDLYIETESGKKFYFEIKYTEAKFGQADDKNGRHTKRFQNEYEEMLTSKVSSKYCEKIEFFKNYQIIRNLIHIDETSYVVFLYPHENTKIREGAELAYNEIILENHKEYLLNHTWKKLVDFIELEVDSKELKGYYKEFGLKYL